METPLNLSALARVRAWLHRRLRRWSARRIAWIDADLRCARWIPEGTVRCSNVVQPDTATTTAPRGHDTLERWNAACARQRVRFLPPPLDAHVDETHPRIIEAAVK